MPLCGLFLPGKFLGAAVQVLKAGKVPPPSTTGCSCVYVVRRSDGYFYCGESDDIRGILPLFEASVAIG